MPLYDYDCAACGRRFEVIHGVDAPGPESCPLCGSGPVRKAFAPPAIHFKGSGWAKKERRAAVKTASKSSDEGGDAASGAPKDKGDEGATASEGTSTPAGDKKTSSTSSASSTATSD